MRHSKKPDSEGKYFTFRLTEFFILMFSLLVVVLVVFIRKVVYFGETEVEVATILLALIVIFITFITLDIKRSLRRPYETTHESIGQLQDTTHETIRQLQNTIEKDIRGRIDLQCKFNTTAKRIDTIVKGINKYGETHHLTEKAIKRLNGVEQIFTRTEVGKDATIDSLEKLNGCNSSFYAVSTASIAECLDPGWLQYFIEQVFICKDKKSQRNSLYLFNWNDVPENDNIPLIEFLENNLKIEWVKNAIIKKSNSREAITVTNGENSLILKLNKKKKKVNLEICGRETYECILKEEKDKLNIYDSFLAKRYFVYDRDKIECYREELATLKRIHELGDIDFTVLDATKLKVDYREVLAKVDHRARKHLENSKPKFSSVMSTDGYIPDFLLTDRDYVYFRGEDGEVKPSDEESKCTYYGALVEFFQTAKNEGKFTVHI